VRWNTLGHPNVLSLLGVMMSNNHLAMASEWMVNGNVNEYVKKHRNANPFELVGLILLLVSLLADDRSTSIAPRCR
jgi:hypothetical protein